MAKKIINDSDTQEETTGQGIEVKPEKEAPAEKPVTSDIPAFVDEILKTKTAYEILYIDSQGSSYVANTPKSIRGSAVLYKNPHFKS